MRCSEPVKGKNILGSCSTTEGGGVGLRTFDDGSFSRRIEEESGIIGRILSLNETVQLRILGCRLTENRISVLWRVGGEVLLNRRSVRNVHHKFDVCMGLTGGVFFSAWRYSIAAATITAAVAASNCLLASVRKNV